MLAPFPGVVQPVTEPESWGVYWICTGCQEHLNFNAVPGSDLLCDLRVTFFSKGTLVFRRLTWGGGASCLEAWSFTILVAALEMTSIICYWKPGLNNVMHWRTQSRGHFGKSYSSPAWFLISDRGKVFIYLLEAVVEISSLCSILREALDGLNNLIFTECSLQDVRGGKRRRADVQGEHCHICLSTTGSLLLLRWEA